MTDYHERCDMLKNLLRRLIPMSFIGGRCPMCGSGDVKSDFKCPMGPVVTDGPTVLAYRCGKCGHTWSMPVRVGP